jgi:hypothetical protein
MEADEEDADTINIQFGPQLLGVTSVAAIKDMDSAQVAYELVILKEHAILLVFWTEFTQKWTLVGLKACMALYLASGSLIVL